MDTVEGGTLDGVASAVGTTFIRIWMMPMMIVCLIIIMVSLFLIWAGADTFGGLMLLGSGAAFSGLLYAWIKI